MLTHFEATIVMMSLSFLLDSCLHNLVLTFLHEFTFYPVPTAQVIKNNYSLR